MTKMFRLALILARTFILACALATATAIPIWSSPAVAYDVMIRGEGGSDTVVKHTYDNKTRKLLKVVRDTEIDDPNDRTKIRKTVEIKKYDQGKRPPYETSIDEQEIVIVKRNGQKDRVVRKRTITTKTYAKSDAGERVVAVEVRKEMELAGFDGRGKPVYTGKRQTLKSKGPIYEKNEVWDTRTGNWVDERYYIPPPKTANSNQRQPAGEPTGAGPGPGGPHYLVDDELNRTKIIRKEPPKPKGELTARLEDDKPAGKPAPKPACDALGGKWHGGTLGQVKKLEASWRKALAKCSAGPDCPKYRGEQSLQFYMRTMMIWQCHATFVKYGAKSSKDDRKNARQEACAIGRTLEKMAAQIKASRYMKAGGNWKPLHLVMQQGMKLKDPCEPENVADAKPKTNCKGGGLVGAMNCVTKKIEEAGSGPRKPPASASSTDPATGITTESVRNPDGSRTVTKTDRAGNEISKETVRKGPASASSTDPATGITTESVRNPDGSRTVTKTDKNGNELSREVVGKDPASARATEIKTGETTTSVANPDGSRTVTKTDAQGNILSREKVR